MIPILRISMTTMLLRFALLISAFRVANAFSIIDRRELIAGMAASLSLPSMSVNFLQPKSSARIKVPAPPDPVDFSGIYRDPQHPSGYRIVRSVGQGVVAITLQNDPKSKVVKLEGTTKYNKKTGESKLSIDFSPKGGPTNLVAEYSPDRLLLVNFCNSGEVLTKGSISFPDGNFWIKNQGIEGVYSDPNHPDGYRVIRDLGSAKISIEFADLGNRPPLFLSGVVNKYKGIVLIDFSPNGGPKKVPAQIKCGNQLVFPDGNAWTKL
jgi:hypothetical protein